MYHFLDVRKSQERQGSKKFCNKCSENSRSQIVFRTDIFRKLTLFSSRSEAQVIDTSRIRVFMGNCKPRTTVCSYVTRLQFYVAGVSNLSKGVIV